MYLYVLILVIIILLGSTFKSVGVDLLHETGGDVTGYKFRLGDDVTQNGDIMIHPYNKIRHIISILQNPN